MVDKSNPSAWSSSTFVLRLFSTSTCFWAWVISGSLISEIFISGTLISGVNVSAAAFSSFFAQAHFGENSASIP